MLNTPPAWEVTVDQESKLTKQLCQLFAQAWAVETDCIKASGFNSKCCYDASTPLITDIFEEGQLLYRKQSKIGNLLP